MAKARMTTEDAHRLPQFIRHSNLSLSAMKCPICKTPVKEEDAGKPGSTFPFCSERCRTIDLARWLDGKYQIPVRHEDESPDIDQLQPDEFDPRRR